MVAPKRKTQPRGKSEFGDRLRAARVECGLTQQELADRSGELQRPEVVRLEGGDNQGSSHRVRNALATGFGVPLLTLGHYLDGDIDLLAFQSVRNGKNARDIAAEIERTKLQRLIGRLGFSDESVRILTGLDGLELRELAGLPRYVQRAAFAVAHLVDDCSIDDAIIAAQRAFLELGEGHARTPMGWVHDIAERVHKHSRTRAAGRRAPPALKPAKK